MVLQLPFTLSRLLEISGSTPSGVYVSVVQLPSPQPEVQPGVQARQLAQLQQARQGGRGGWDRLGKALELSS